MKLCNLVIAGCISAFASVTQAYPDRPITLIVPFAPGGSSDIIGRTIAPQLSEKLGKPVVIENVGGAGGTIGTQRVVRAAPDGYTVLLGSGSEILINKLINPKTPYDGLKDLKPLAFIGTGPMVLIGKTTLSAASVGELLALAKQKPGAMSYASAGNGTPMQCTLPVNCSRCAAACRWSTFRIAAPLPRSRISSVARSISASRR
jgi:tripartite-type tricarboxylate transporter receptor subunit TctC